MSSRTSTFVGIVVALLIIGAVATIGYYQVEVAPGLATTSTTSAPSVVCPSSQCSNVTIGSGAYSPPSGYTAGATTQYGYAPDVITVVIGVNNTLYFINQDSAIHTATSDTTGIFDTGNINPGGTAQVTLTTPGTYPFKCIYHAWMQGTVVVKAAQSNSTTS
jgi:plastocyanin